MKRSFIWDEKNKKLVERKPRKELNDYGVVFDDYKKKQLAQETSRKHMDQLSGLSKAKGATRGDYKLCREADKVLGQYKRFKDKGDRTKIQNEYFNIQGNRKGVL